MPVDTEASALYVRELFGDLPVAHLEQVDTADVAVAPVEAPADGGPVTGDDHLLGLEAGVRRLGEELLPEPAHVALTDVTFAVRCRQRVLEDAVIGHQLHHRVHVVPAERFVEGLDRLFGVHAWPIMREITSPRFGPPLPNGTECTRCAKTIS